MFKAILTVDPKTHHALYDDEQKVMGIFATMQDLAKALRDILVFCEVYTKE